MKRLLALLFGFVVAIVAFALYQLIRFVLEPDVKIEIFGRR